MPSRREQVVRYVPRSVCDTLDGDNVAPGAMRSLSNLIFDPSTPGVYQCRPANTQVTDFASFSDPGVVSVIYELNNRIYGLIASSRNAGKDEPFVYDLAANAFVTVANVSSANTPTTQSTTGEWVPPTVDMVGTKIIITHPGFNYTGGYAFGFFDISGFTLTTNGTTDGTTALITGFSSTVGIEPGYAVSGSGVPSGAIVVNKTTSTITISANTTSAHTATPITFTGGTEAAPRWCAGNTTGALQLPAIARSVAQFNNRAYFAVGNAAVFTDTLSFNITNSPTVQVLTIDSTDPIIGFGKLPFFSTTGGTIQSLLPFKQYSIWQIIGDPTSSNLSLNQLSGSTGTVAARSIVSMPDGVFFRSNDGVRVIKLSGEVTEPNSDLAVPFIYALYPSRIAAAFNADTYRISLQNSKLSGSPHQEYHYSPRYDGWTGPHTFANDCLVAYQNDFIVCSNQYPGALWRAYTVQDLAGAGQSMVENGVQLTWEYMTAPMTSVGNMYANSVVRSTLELAASFTGDVITFQAYDSNAGVASIAFASYTLPLDIAIWGVFVWGAAYWGATQLGLGPITIPWGQPIIFNELVIQARSNSSLDLKLGSMYIGYERLGYLKQ